MGIGVNVIRIREETTFRLLVAIVVIVNWMRAVADLDGSISSWVGVIAASLFVVYLPPMAWKYTKDRHDDA